MHSKYSFSPFLKMHNLFNCFKIIICVVYPVHLSLTTLRNLTLYLEDRNDISDKVQKLNSDCSLMELIYSFFFSFLSFFFFLLSVWFREILTQTTCFVHAPSHSRLIGRCSEFLRPGEGKDDTIPVMIEHLLSLFQHVMLLYTCQRNIT